MWWVVGVVCGVVVLGVAWVVVGPGCRDYEERQELGEGTERHRGGAWGW